MNSLTDKYTLINSVEVPCIAFGTWKMPEEVAANAVKCAIESGYRHIDTAAAYQNEEYVGKGIRESGVKRDEIFLVSKLPNDDHGYQNAIDSCERSLKRLKTDYLDSYLIHWPVLVENVDRLEDDLCETWRAFEKLYNDGKLRSIGTSNFLEEHIEIIKRNFSTYPMINQVQMHPQNPQEEMIAYCKENKILPEAWSPLIQGQAFKRELLIKMAECILCEPENIKKGSAIWKRLEQNPYIEHCFKLSNCENSDYIDALEKRFWKIWAVVFPAMWW